MTLRSTTRDFRAVCNQQGNRFAIIVDTWRGGSHFLDTSGKLVARRIVAYSDDGRTLASVPVRTEYHRDFDFSISPDGHHLGILDEDVVTVADLQ